MTSLIRPTISNFLSNSSEKYNQISGFIWEKLQKKTSWRKIYKVKIISIQTLDLIDFLLKNGSPSAKSSFKLDLHHIKSLENYQYMINGEDKGFESISLLNQFEKRVKSQLKSSQMMTFMKHKDRELLISEKG